MKPPIDRASPVANALALVAFIILAVLAFGCASTPEPPTTNPPPPVTQPPADAVALLWFARDTTAPVLSARPASSNYWINLSWNWSASCFVGQYGHAAYEAGVAELNRFVDASDQDAMAAAAVIADAYRKLPETLQNGSAICAGIQLAVEDAGMWPGDYWPDWDGEGEEDP